MPGFLFARWSRLLACHFDSSLISGRFCSSLVVFRTNLAISAHSNTPKCTSLGTKYLALQCRHYPASRSTGSHRQRGIRDGRPSPMSAWSSHSSPNGAPSACGGMAKHLHRDCRLWRQRSSAVGVGDGPPRNPRVGRCRRRTPPLRNRRQ